MQGELFTNFNVYGGVALLDAKLENTDDPATSGTDVVGSPDVRANLFMEYFFEAVEGLSANANFQYTGKRAGNNINSFDVDDFFTVDLGLRYERQLDENRYATFRLAVTNLFDEHYWASIFPASIDGATAGRNNAFLGAPREIKFSASIEF